MNRQEKGQVIDDLHGKFSAAKAVVFTDYKGMTVAELTELRRVLRSSSLEYTVVKNTLARIASQETGVSVGAALFEGPVGLAIGFEDPVLAVKKILEYKKTNEKLQIKGAVVEGKLVDQNEVREIASLPSREVLQSMLAGAFQAPLSKLAGLLAATVNRFAYALQALEQKKG